MRRLTPLVYLGSNLISLVGVVLVTTAGILWLLLLPSWWRDEMTNPYIGILANTLLPVLFFGGLIVIPIGIWLDARKRHKAGDLGRLIPRGGELKKLAIFVSITTFVNLVIGSQLLYSAVSYMDSDAFCGQACHTVMQPEYTAYSHSPHARVSCTDCHIGPGAPWFVKSKISGTGQLIAVVLNTYPKPIPSPVEALRPARETCERCHWPQRFSGDLFFVRTHFGNDEQNTPATTVALMRVGGQNWKGTVGIHGAHSSAQARMTYVSTDKRRQVIPQVTYTGPDGKSVVFHSTDVKVTPVELAKGETRTMDCMDCHNRPTHIFQLPENAVDQAMAQEKISPKLPFVKKQAVEVLRREYPDRATGTREIAAALYSFYKAKTPTIDPALVQSAVEAVQSIYLQNIFPEMKITWGTYPNNLGHMDFPGCFRCHDGNHASSDGRTISNDCATCHDLLAMDEKDPKVLNELRMNQAPASNSGATK